MIYLNIFAWLFLIAWWVWTRRSQASRLVIIVEETMMPFKSWSDELRQIHDTSNELVPMGQGSHLQTHIGLFIETYAESDWTCNITCWKKYNTSHSYVGFSWWMTLSKILIKFQHIVGSSFVTQLMTTFLISTIIM